MARVLVGVPTYDGQRYCRKLFIDFLRTLTCPDLDFLFVTNGGEEDAEDLGAAVEPLRTAGRKVTVLVDEGAAKLDRLDRIVSSRNIVRDEFLKGGWTHLYFIDSDVVGPKNQVEALLQHAKPLVSGWYLNYYKDRRGRDTVRPVVYGPHPGAFARQLKVSEVLRPGLLSAVMAGLGCCLLARPVLDQVAFRRDAASGAGEDACFFIDAAALGFGLVCDTRVSCGHLRFPAGDPRNDALDPRRYRLGNASESL